MPTTLDNPISAVPTAGGEIKPSETQAPAHRLDFRGGDGKDSVTFGLIVSAVSDYVFRGISLSNRQPALQGSVEVELPSWQGLSPQLGLWLSSVDFMADADIPVHGGAKVLARQPVRSEAGIYGSITGHLAAGWRWKGQFSYYKYPGFSTLDWAEWGLSLHREFAQVSFKPSIELGSSRFGDMYITGSEGIYLEANAKLELSKHLALTLHAGQTRHIHPAVGGPDYWDGALALEFAIGRMRGEIAHTWITTTHYGELGLPATLFKITKRF